MFEDLLRSQPQIILYKVVIYKVLNFINMLNLDLSIFW